MNNSKRKLKILQVGWGWPPKQSGGAIMYTKALCGELAKRGHEVYYFYTGDQNLFPISYLTQKKEDNINIIELVNSPNFYNTKFNDSTSELSNKIIERKFIKVLSQIEPDIVHFQNFPGICASLATLAKEKGCIVVNSMHNYIPICPVGELFNYETSKICDLKKCSNCYKKATKKQKIKEKIFLSFEHVLSKEIQSSVYELSAIFTGKAKVGIPDNTSKSFSLEKTKTDRLNYFSSVLKNVDLNLAVSSMVKKIFSRYLDIPESKIMVNHVGTEMQDVAKAATKKNRSIVTFIFLGSLAEHKGFQNLLKAFKQLDQDKTQLLVYAPIVNDYKNKKVILEKKYSIKFQGPYKLSDLPKILSKADVGIVPPIWHDNAPRIVFEMQSANLPIIASNVGGMSDFVIDNKNGFIFQFDDCGDLQRKMQNFIDNHSLLDSFSNHIRPVKTIAQNAKEIEAIYHSLISNGQ